jgi:hypothetical protein
MHVLTQTPAVATRAARTFVLLGALLVLLATLAPQLLRAQDGPGTRYIECLDTAVDNLASCYFEADGYRWREMLCNFAYYADNIACSADLIF